MKKHTKWNLNGKSVLGNGVNGTPKMGLNDKWNCVLDPYGSGYSPVASSCEHDNETSGSIKVTDFLTELLSASQGLFSMFFVID
jgi:hypothetical protein